MSVWVSPGLSVGASRCEWQWTGMYSLQKHSIPRIGFGSTMTLTKIKKFLKINERMNDQKVFYLVRNSLFVIIRGYL